MKTALSFLCLTGILLGFSVNAAEQVEESLSCDAVQKLLIGGSSAGEVVRTAMETGRGLAEATVYAMGCSGEENREAIAIAGIEAADNLAQAQSVADAVLAIVGETGPVAEAVRVAMQDYIKLMPQPDVYEDKYSPTGGDSTVSPAA